MNRVAVAPMMDCTDRHYRYFARLLSPSIQLYTEMITTAALIHAGPQRFLSHHITERPLVLQLGGSEPEDFKKSIPLIKNAGFEAINLNIGCPSPRVQAGAFGACLMLQPQVVAESVNILTAELDIPITIKTRIGVDQHDSYDFLRRFVDITQKSGCSTYIIHARKAWLNGLSPKENREIPPLYYETVYQIKKDYPHLHIGINGGIQSIEEIKQHLDYVDSVMIGRACYYQPYFLTEIERAFFNPDYIPPSREESILAFLPYLQEKIEQGVKPYSILRHLLGLYKGIDGNKAWRNFLTRSFTGAEHSSQKNLDLIKHFIDRRLSPQALLSV